MTKKIFLVIAAVCCNYLLSFAGGFIITNASMANIQTQRVQDYTLYCKKLRVDVQMDGPIAVTTVEQTFEKMLLSRNSEWK
jgi:hypothetical protein